MSPDEHKTAEEMMALCARAKEKNVVLALAYTEGDVNIYCCSHTEPDIVRAITRPEVANLTGDYSSVPEES